MKKHLIISLVSSFLLAAVSANAASQSNFFVGADFTVTNTRHKVSDQANLGTILLTNSGDYVKEDKDRRSFGVNAGYKVTINDRYFIAPEIFYDRLSSESYDFYHAEPDQNYVAPYDKLRINNRFGARLNLGYNLFTKLGVFVNAGMARVAYEFDLTSIGQKDRSIKVSPIFGFGVNYKLSNNWSAKLAYDIQKMNLRYVDNGLRDSVELETFRFGIAYNF